MPSAVPTHQGYRFEGGFTQRPPIRATWTPKGRTPVIREPFSWQHLSGIGAVLTTPTWRRVRWFLTLHCDAIRGPRVARFLAALRRHVRGRVILLWDRLPAHRSRLVALARHQRWLTTVWLPAYAPELSPLEPFWAHLDTTTLANTPADDPHRLRRQVRIGLQRIRRRPHVARGFLQCTGLS